MFWGIVSAAIAGLGAWRLFRPGIRAHGARRPGWRFVPLVSGVLLLVLVVVTLGAAFLLAPLPFLLTIVASRALGESRGVVFWLGAGLNVWWMLLFVISAAAIGYDALIA